MTTMTDEVLSLVKAERARQERFVSEGKFPASAASNSISHGAKLAILVEEVGEVAEEINEAVISQTKGIERSVDFLRMELIQVAAVAVAFAESLEPSGLAVTQEEIP